MRNKTLEGVIDDIIANSDLSEDVKPAFNKYVKNMFEGNASEDDLRKVLNIIDYKEEEL